MILAFIIINAIVIIFYKVIHNTKLAFNLVITRYLNFFYAKVLIFLFIIIYCSKNKYQNKNKVIKSFDRKIA